MWNLKRATGSLVLASLAIGSAAFGVQAQTTSSPVRVQVTGEVVDTFCSVSEIMFASGTAHYQCAVWCAVGGVPVGIRGTDGEIYLILRIEEDENNVANPKLVTFQAREVTVDGELFKRDGVNYLLVSKVATDKGIVTLSHDEHGIVPLGE